MTLNVALVAPFGPGESFGGSQRGTSAFERLTARGLTVRWVTVPPRVLSRRSRMGHVVRGRPSSAAFFSPPADLADGADVVVVEHSYLAASVLRVRGRARLVVDFQNLEHESLAGMAASYRPSPRRAVLTAEAMAMRRLERQLLSKVDGALFTSTEEAGWAATRGPATPTLVVPNVLPAAFAEEARTVAHGRRTVEPMAYYMGKLDHRTNSLALLGFLGDRWEALRARWPGLRLVVVGRSTPDLARELKRHPGVEVHGFVEDPRELMRRAAFAILPFENSGGTSLRVLYYALAQMPLIGSPLAFRGMNGALGVAAASAQEWEDGVALALDPDRAAVVRRRALARAAEIQADPQPWDALAAALTAVADGRGFPPHRA